MKQIYLDYSATTPVKPEVLEEMIPYFTEFFGNPSSLYDLSYPSKDAIAKARGQVASLINCDPAELFFTSCGSESDNWVLFGVADAQRKKGGHIITTSIEHHAILHTGDYQRKHGLDVTYLPVDEKGFITPDVLEAAIRPDTVLISIMYVNNEVGTVQNIKELAEIAHAHGITFHTDAVQALGNVNCDVQELGVDLMSMSAHKIYGPKGVGALYIRKGTRISNYLHGGAQESKHRAGTENVPGIVGFGKAAELAKEHFEDHVAHSSSLRDYFVDRVLSEIPHTYLNGSREHRHPGNANITFEYIEGESILLLLNYYGICVSTGSACSSASLTPSHVLSAMGIPPEIIHGTIRFTVGDMTTKEDLDYTVDKLKEVVGRLREISAVSEEKGW
ncbi:MAG: cysteine desulfurase NifS [Clostridiales bacterium]|nr:cysteine desulfurase NifS [Clostridiales bacterium]